MTAVRLGTFLCLRQNIRFPLSFYKVERLKAELMYERRTSEEQLSGFEDERRVWQEEKEKVRKRKSFSGVSVSFVIQKVIRSE